MYNTTFLLTISGIALTAACHSAPPPAEPKPAPVPEVAMNLHPVDTLFDAARRTADSLAWANELAATELAYQDSVEKVRLAFANGNSEANQENAELRGELGVMVHFDVAQASLQADGRDALDRKVAILNANPDVRLRITGACDERGSDEYNQALGLRRAAEVRRYLVAKGIGRDRLEQMSSGETSPIDAGNDESAWVQNRRAEFLIVSGDTPLAMLQ